ncbi:MAG: serine/threonine protein kinase [Micavibrio sp.]|nr:serine/threonine protein kinase [Micavibrio sp.]
MDYIAFGRTLIAQYPQSRTIRGRGLEDNLWVKQAVPPKARIWHLLQKIIAICVPNPMLRATVSNGGGNALRMEATRLQEFRAKGFHAPEVLAFNDEMLILTHLGPQLRDALDQMKDAEQRLAVMKIATAELARLHNAGLAHGRPYLRDMTWDGDKIGFLDLEENPVDVMPLAFAQARDVWVFLSAASRFARVSQQENVYSPDTIFALLAEYRRHAGAAALPELAKFVHTMRPVRYLLERRWLWDRVGSDVRQSVFVTQCLEVCFDGGKIG